MACAWMRWRRCCTRLFAQGGRVDSEPIRRERESGSHHRCYARSTKLRIRSRRGDDRGRIDRISRCVEADVY